MQRPGGGGQAIGSRAAWAVLAITLIVQFGLQAYFFPLSELLTAKRLVYIDAPFHQYQMAVAQALCAQSHLVGYEPFFSAGYLGGVTFNASAKVPALMACLAGSADGVAPAYKLFSFWIGVIAPAAIVGACLLLRLPARMAALSALFALLSWWTGPMRWYHTAGLVAYVGSAYLVIPFTVATVQACAAPRAPKLAALAAGGALGMLLHPLFPVAVALLAAPAVLFEWRSAAAVKRTALVASCLLAGMLLVNGAWLYATLTAPSFTTVDNPYQRVVDPLLVLKEPLGLAPTARGGARLYLALLVGVLSCAVLWRRPQRRALLGLVAGAALLMLWASVGALNHAIASLQPNRFSALAWVAVIVPAACGLCALADRALRGRSRHRLAALGALGLAGLVLLYYVREAGLEIFGDRTARYAVMRPEVKGEGALSNDIVDFLKTRTDASARVYFETSFARIHDGGHMAGLYALAAGREFIGGPYPFTDYASAWDHFAFGRELAGFTPEQLQRQLDTYNVKWMLCHTAGCRAAMGALPGTTVAAVLGPVTAYERRIVGNFALSGNATIAARCVNRIDVHAEASDEIVLKYHWVPGLVAVPPADVGPREVLAGARPFIAVRHPPPDFVLTVGGGSPPPCPAVR